MPNLARLGGKLEDVLSAELPCPIDRAPVASKDL
eukprot:SAG31_NODE_36451_length_313_cov_0.785047_1_plen_33_part_01